MNRTAPIALLAVLAVAACHKPPAPGYRLYVTNETSGDLTVIDEPSHRVVAVVRLGKRPRGLQAGPDGRQVFIALSGSPIAPPGVDEDKLPPPDRAADGIGVFDAPGLRLARTLKGVANPEQLALAAGGPLYAPSEESRTLQVLDPASGAVTASLPVGEEPEGVAVSPDGRLVLVTVEGDDTVKAVDAATRQVLGQFAAGKRPRSVTFSPDGRRAFVTGENDASITLVDPASRTVLRTARIAAPGAKPMGVAVSPDGKRVYVTTGRGGTLEALDADTLAPLGSVKVGQRPWGVALSPDGRFAYTANGQSDDVAVVDTGRMAVVARIPSGGRPWGVLVAPRCCG